MENTPTSHIESAILIFDNIVTYNYEAYKMLIQKLLMRHHVIEKWQMKAFIKLSKGTIFETEKLEYNITNDELEIREIKENTSECTTTENKEKIFKPFPIINEDSSNPENTLFNSIHRILLYAEKILPKRILANSKWQNEFEEYAFELSQDKKAALIQLALIDVASEEQKIFFDEINIAFFSHLAKSLLNAEYLLMDNYTVLLNKIIDYDFGFDEEFNPLNKTYPYLVKSFIIIACHEKEICVRIRHALKNKGSRRINLDIEPEEYADVKLGDRILIGENRTAHFGKLIKSITDMTIIDHIYKTSEANIKKLLTLKDRIEHTRTKIKSTPSNKKGEKLNCILDMVEIKMSCMLYAMLSKGKNKQRPKQEFFFTQGYIHDVDLYPKFENASQVIDCKKNIYIQTRLANINKTTDISTLPSSNTYYNNTHNDLSIYNNIIEEGIHNYCLISSIIFQIRTDEDTDNTISNISKFYDEHKNKLTPAFYINAIEYLDTYISKKSISTDKRGIAILLFDELLSGLSQYINSYKSSYTIRFIPSFEYSFYKADKKSYTFHQIEDHLILNYDYENFKETFFFASLGCTPLNTEYLDYFYKHHQFRNRKYSAEHNKNINLYLQTNSDKAKKLAETLKQDIAETRQQTIQLLGIFAAFLAFVTIAVGLTKVATNIHEFALFCTTYTLSLILFVTLIKATIKEEEDEKNEENKLTLKRAWKYIKQNSIVILLFLIFISLLLLIPLKKEQLKDTSPKTIINQDFNNMTTE